MSRTVRCPGDQKRDFAVAPEACHPKSVPSESFLNDVLSMYHPVLVHTICSMIPGRIHFVTAIKSQ